MNSGWEFSTLTLLYIVGIPIIPDETQHIRILRMLINGGNASVSTVCRPLALTDVCGACALVEDATLPAY